MNVFILAVCSNLLKNVLSCQGPKPLVHVCTCITHCVRKDFNEICSGCHADVQVCSLLRLACALLLTDRWSQDIFQTMIVHQPILLLNTWV